MASAAQFSPISNRALTWFLEWLRDELTPYPGRTLLVVRMVLAATLIMLIGTTFQIPYTWQGAIYALLVSRESPRATLKSAATICFVTGIGAAYIILSMKLAINILPLHFLWIIATLFFVFYGISTLTNYLVAVALVNTISAGIPLWDRHLPAEANVEDTLWLCLAVLIAVAVTAGVELVFVRQPPGDEVVLLINDRLSAVENLLACYAQDRAPDPGIEQKIIQLEMLGTSLLRRTLRRSDYLPRYSTEMAALAALVGRLVDLAATLTQLSILPSASNQSRFQRLASAVASISNSLTRREVPTAVQFNADKESAAPVPLLGEMERTVTMMSEVLTGSRSVAEYLPSPDDLPQSTLLSRDAFVNHDHLRFALKGCLAASSCYVMYNALAWPGISTAVTTCLLTALSTIGASHQKQILRIAGAIVGGFVLGMGSQMFILPYLDSITGFLFLFVLVTALSSWFLTSSPRLSYFGVQVALAFYLTTLQEFKIQTSLAVARDRVAGILLGLFMMWLVFDRLWGAPASIEMKRTFISNLRAMAHFIREPASNDPRIAIARTLTLRETINANLDRARALADGILFEFGPSRRRDLKLRSQIRRWQPKLRTLFVMRITSLKYRLQLPGFEWSETVRRRQQAYDEQSAQMLEKMADCIEGDRPAIACGSDESAELLKWTIEETLAEKSRGLLDGQAQSFIILMRGIDGLTSSLASDIAAELGSPAEGC
jgi:multidrug resistance protein MdtO